MSHESSQITMLDSGSIHEILSIQIHRFQQEHRSLPEIVFLNSNLRMAFTLELMKLQGFSSAEAVAEPVWIQGFGRAIPLLYSSSLGDDYLRLLNRSLLASAAL